MSRIAGRFTRVEPRRHARDLALGLMLDLPGKNCQTIAEHAGHATPGRLQHLLARAVRDADGVRDDLRGYVTEHLGDEDAVLVVDETGDLKKGTATVAVQRQYTGTAGRIENAQVAVYLTYATRAGHAQIDRALYLPASWAGDQERRAAAGVPAGVEFATKPELARQMIVRALDGGAAAPWVAGDEVYGADPGLRRELENRATGYVLAVACSHQVTTAAGPQRADAIAARLPRRAWQRVSAGQGSKGPRFYDWAWITIDSGAAPAGQHSLLIRRNNTTGELAYYRCYAPAAVPLATLVRVAGRRWTVGGDLPGREGPGRAGPAPGPPLELLAPLDDPRHARQRLPRRARRHREHPPATTRGHDPPDQPRDPPPAQRPPRPARPQHQAPPALVSMAATAPAPRQDQPLSKAQPDMKITKSGCRTRQSHFIAGASPISQET